MGFFDRILNNNSVSSEKLKAMIANGAYLVDVRSSGEFSGGSGEGAVNIPLDQIANRTDELKGKDSIVVFCRSGNRSGQAKSILEQKGFENVINGGTWEQVNNLIQAL
ncbi:MAG: rhodanese-like domain-containing protein [Brumimicrobium sp.]